jgi:predicted exporter
MHSAAPPRLAPWRATLVLLAFLAAGLAVLFGVQRAHQRVSVDIVELLPTTEDDPAIALTRQAATGRPGRVLLIALWDAKARQQAPLDAARKLSAQLAGEKPIFAASFAGFDDAARDRLTKFFFDRRLALRLPSWFAAKQRQWRESGKEGAPDSNWLADASAVELRDFLATPDAIAMADMIPRDPLLLLPTFLGELSDLTDASGNSGDAVSAAGLQAEGPDGVHYALVQTEIGSSPLDDAGQEPVFAALQRHLDKLRAENPQTDLKMRLAGTNLLAADARKRVGTELLILSHLSLGGIFILLLVAFRRPVVFAHLLLPILASSVWAWVVTLCIYPRVHVIPVIFSTIIVGVAVDYGILAVGSARPGSISLREALQRNRRTLIMACLTAVSGFLFMLLNELPLLRQMGLSVALGVAGSLIIYFLYLPWMPALPVREAKATGWAFLPNRSLLVLGLVLAIAAVGALFLARPRWGDNLRAWQRENPQLLEEVRSVRALFGRAKDDVLMLNVASDQPSAFARMARMNGELAARKTESERFLNVGRILPGPQETIECRQYFAAHPDFVTALRAAFDTEGFDADSFAPFFADLESFLRSDALPNPSALLPSLRDVLPLPLQILWSEDGVKGPAWFVSNISRPLLAKMSKQDLAAVSAIPLDQVEALNAALARYRDGAFRFGAVGVAVLYGVLLIIFGWRRGLFMVCLPTLSAVVATAALGFAGRDLGLLQVVGLLLGMCLSSDYAIFLGSPNSALADARRSIRLSALAALLSFGVLLFSTNPALQGLCLTVVFVVGCAFLLCEISQLLAARSAR